MDDDGDSDLSAALASKASPLFLGSWTTMAANVEGRDKSVKIVQFGARALKYYSEVQGLDASGWDALFKTTQEGRKSARIMKGINKVNECFEQVPAASSSYEKALIIGQHMGLALHWHYDYLAHAHRMKFARFSPEQYERVFRIPGSSLPPCLWLGLRLVSLISLCPAAPGFIWSISNVSQILRGLLTIRRTTESFNGVDRALQALGPGEEEERARLAADLRRLRVKRFGGWLMLIKGIADLITSSNMSGPKVNKRFPGICGWMNEGIIGISGVVSALVVVFNKFPNKPAGAIEKAQPRQAERNAMGFIFGLMQVITLWNARYHEPPPRAVA